MVTTDHTHPSPIKHPTRHGGTATAYFLLGHLLRLSATILVAAVLYRATRNPDTLLSGGTLALLAIIWFTGPLAARSTRLAWAEVPGAYRVWVAPSSTDENHRTVTAWDYAFRALHSTAIAAVGAWLITRDGLPLSGRVATVGLIGGGLMVFFLARTVTQAWQALGEPKEVTRAVTFAGANVLASLVWVAMAIAADPSGQSHVAVGASLAAVMLAVVAAFHVVMATHRDQGLPAPAAALVHHTAVAEPPAGPVTAAWWWSTWRQYLPLTIPMTLAISVYAAFTADLTQAVILPVVLLLASLVTAPAAVRVASPRRRWQHADG